MTATSGSRHEYDDISGTYVFDLRRARQGYHLNMFCMSLQDPSNREAFKADEDAYLERFDLSDDECAAIRARDWIRLLELGGNVYYTFKIAATDGLTFQQVAAQQTGMTEDEYLAMMFGGGRHE